MAAKKKASKWAPNLDRTEQLTKKRNGGEEPEVNIKQVKALALVGCTNREIAEYFGVSTQLIKRRFHDVLTKRRARHKSILRRAQWRAAVDGLNPAMLIWLGKQILDQREPEIKINWDTLSDEQLKDIEEGKLPKNLKRGR